MQCFYLENGDFKFDTVVSICLISGEYIAVEYY